MIPDDEEIDRRLRELASSLPADPARLSARVLTRIAQPPHPGPLARIGRLLVEPGGLAALTGASVMTAVAVGYAVLPLMSGELSLLIYLGRNMNSAAGF